MKQPHHPTTPQKTTFQKSHLVPGPGSLGDIYIYIVPFLRPGAAPHGLANCGYRITYVCLFIMLEQEQDG